MLKRTDEHGLDAFLADDGEQVLLCGVDALAHEALGVEILTVAHIAADKELHGLGVAGFVGHGNGAFVRAINQGILGRAVHQCVVEDKYAKRTHGGG